MAKQKSKNNKRGTKSYPPIMTFPSFKTTTSPLLSPLDILAERRTGGSDSIKGFIFQCKYAAWKILTHFSTQSSSETRYVRLEGIEDLDVSKIFATNEQFIEFIQTKSSEGQMKNVTKFWEKGILQNFAEVYLKDTNSHFRLVYDTPLAQGYLSHLADACQNKKALALEDLNYWQGKFDTFRQKQEKEQAEKKHRMIEVWDWSKFDFAGLLQKITFELVSEVSIVERTRRLLIGHYAIINGNEGQYLQAFYWRILSWSKERARIQRQDIIRFIEEVKEAIAKGHINPVVQRQWLVPLSFEQTKELSFYFEGKAARPSDIVAGLPAQRNYWEQKILDTFKEADITVIRASSGQGKSTLAWQVTSHLLRDGWKPYELCWCENPKEIGHFITFLESRIKIGELPIVIIDGLRSKVIAWAELAKRTVDLPIKYIVTTREEDWYRFGIDISQFRLKSVQIDMNEEEAKDIFKQFKNADKLASKNLNWQSVWENVKEQHLLIEYVYLLTQGTMMEERLEEQIKAVNKEQDGRAKLEILRLIAVADLCSVHLPTSDLVRSIEKRITIQGDIGEILKSLEREYHIQIEHSMYVEGLHSVRSQHLSTILHATLPLIDTLLNLLQLLEPESLFEFCAHAPLMVEGAQRVLLLEKLAEHVALRSYPEIIKTIEGLLASDAFHHWKLNQDKYDDLFMRGGLNELTIADAFPWSGLTTFKNLSKLEGRFGNTAQAILEAIKQIVPFHPEISDTFTFLKVLSKYLILRENVSDLIGLGRLAKWYDRFGLKFTLLDKIDDTKLWQSFHVLDFEGAGELFTVCSLMRPEVYQKVVTEHKPEIIGILKHRTKTLTVAENGENLVMEYLLNDGVDNEKSSNEQSVERINVISSFLSEYQEFHIKQYCGQFLKG